MLVADLLKGQEAAVQISGEILLLKIVEGHQRLRRFLQIGDAVRNDLQLLLGLIPFCFCFIQPLLQLDDLLLCCLDLLNGGDRILQLSQRP